ncbi:MAG: MFS transporter [Anaerolineae bacterium]
MPLMTESAPIAPTSQTSTQGRRLQITGYATAVFFYWVALYLYVPTLPTYAESRTENLAMVGVILAQYGLWQALVRLPLGILTDWVGRRKPFILGGFLLAALAALVMARAGGVPGLVVGRAISGLAAATWVPLVVAFSALFPPHEAVRASAILTFVGSAGRMLATAVTGSLNAWGGYSLAFFGAAAAAVVAVLVLLPVVEHRRPSRPPNAAAIGRLISRRDVLLPSLLSLVTQYAVWTTTFGFVPILARQFGANDVALSLLVSLNIAVATLGNLAATAIVGRVGPRRLVVVAFACVFVAVLGASLAPHLVLLYVATVFMAIAQGIGGPVLMGMSIQRVDDAERATAMGLHQAVYAIGMFSGPWLSGILADAMGIRPMLAVTAVACLSLGLLGSRGLAARRSNAG